MKVLVLGASGFLGGHIYNKIKITNNIEVIGTRYADTKNEELYKLNVNENIEVESYFKQNKPDIIIWCLMSKTNEQELIENGITNILRNISFNQKFIYISTNALFNNGSGYFNEQDIPTYLNDSSKLALYSNAKFLGEDLVKLHDNHIIVRPGIIYGQDIYGKWDNRILEIIHKLSLNEKLERSRNMYNTFVKVEELANAIIELINLEYKGILHLGPENKQSYYNFYKDMAERLKLNEKLIIASEDEGYVFDKSINTKKCRTILKSFFT